MRDCDWERRPRASSPTGLAAKVKQQQQRAAARSKQQAKARSRQAGWLAGCSVPRSCVFDVGGLTWARRQGVQPVRGTVRALRPGSAKLAQTQNRGSGPGWRRYRIQDSSEQHGGLFAVAVAWTGPWHQINSDHVNALHPIRSPRGQRTGPDGGAASDCLLHGGRDACGGRPAQQPSVSRRRRA